MSNCWLLSAERIVWQFPMRYFFGKTAQFLTQPFPFFGTAFVACCLFGSEPLFAQSRTDKPIDSPPTRIQSTAVPAPRFPTVGIRQLLAMTPAEQERALADKSEEKRKVLQAKLQEYAKLSPDERESSVQLIQLSLYLPPLMKLAPADRAEKIKSVPAEDRKLIEERLKLWDGLPPEAQKEVLEHERTLLYFFGLESDAPAQPGMARLPEGAKQLDERVEKWRALAPERRQVMYGHFRQFFELPRNQKEKTLEVLTDRERRDMEKSLQAFEQLAPAHREMCIDSFQQFASMSKAERDQFLKNTERWKAMSAQERATWRNLVGLFPQPRPPLPPGASSSRPLPGANVPPEKLTNTPALPGSPPKKP
jgi:hypothetical protein